MSKKFQLILVFVFGVVFISTLIVIALYQSTPTSFQYTVFKTVLSLAGAGVAAVIPGFLVVNVSNWIRAGGGLAVFAVLYFWNPALPIPEPQGKDNSAPPKTEINVAPGGMVANNSGPGTQNNVFSNAQVPQSK